ncbi:zinc finger CCCH domain-containing protein 15 homolog [Anopheles funestus]|uniref:zinc finger CCCH domain-containing protein 15 homolog n=1 Tax=Anopheles funestus TaxID=62324 RepID=UPI0020C6ED19|nr:zinc finger CCCH domain-containing protein 15 homolog [Anopheles funestus]XP_049280218.1 zinc finger CCCH domain-containing protein 15 homolog [Anopheles funestus]
MPPKKAPSTSKKTEAKKKEKIIEDKTFGLKNKKGAKQQKFISQVEKQVKSGGQHNLAQNVNVKKEEKEKKLKEQKELAKLFKPVATQKLEAGADPKSVLCAFFKQGTCTKGDKCKFSHDPAVERKSEKRSIHVDMRDADMNDTIENWTEEKLAEVVAKKHGKEKTMPTTTIICKYFLDAVERSLYGWFWECPNGEKCIYRHALPPGYVLKKDKKKAESQKEEISLVDLIERERAALGPSQTRVTLESFLAWKKRKIQEKKDKLQKEEERKLKDFKAGRQNGLSGREMFSFNPDLIDDGMDDGEVAVESYGRNEDEDDTIEYRELDLNMLSLNIKDVDNTGTVAESDRWEKMAAEAASRTIVEDIDGENAAAGTTNDAAPINENLFLEEDLEGLDDELSDDDDDEEDDGEASNETSEKS